MGNFYSDDAPDDDDAKTWPRAVDLSSYIGLDSQQMSTYVPEAPLDRVVDAPCCEWFAPDVHQLSRGAHQTPHWNFTRPQVFPACTNPTRTQRGEHSCPYAGVDAPRLCNVYAEEHIEVLMHATTTSGELLALEYQRRVNGVPRYAMRSHVTNEMGEAITEIWAMDGAKEEHARKEFTTTLKRYKVTDVSVAPAKPEPESFFAKLVS